jgi:hypothetical protein
MINYFLVYRPFHLTYSKRIIIQYFKGNRNIIINHFNSNKNSYEIVENNISIVNISNNFFHRIDFFIKIKKEIQKNIKRKETINFFIPHTFGILANYAYFKLSRNYKNVNINIYYEGIILFYNYHHKLRLNFLSFIGRFITGLITGMFYTIKTNLLDLNSPVIKYIYTPYEKINAPKEKIIITNLEKINYIPNSDICLILASPLKTNETNDKLLMSLYLKIQNLQIKNVFFKDHPSEKSSFYYEQIASKMNIDINIIDDKSPIEDIIKYFAPKYIFSFFSSSILNLHVMVPSETEIICFTLKEDEMKHKNLIDIFSQFEIKIEYV